MFKKNRLSPHDLPPIDTSLFDDDSRKNITEPYLDRYIKRRRRMLTFAKQALASTLFFGTAISPYVADVHHNIIESEKDKASLSVIYPALSEKNKHKATIFFHGFNTPGAEDLAAKLGPEYQAQPDFDSQVWAVDYNNAPLNADAIRDLIEQKIKDEDINEVSFVLYSEGGVIGTKVATKLLESSWADIENVTCLSCASSFDTLTEKTKSEIGIARNLAWIPYIEYSTLFRLGAEAYFYRNDMQQNLANASNGIMVRYNMGNMTNNLFLSSQINDMVEANVASDVESWQRYAEYKHIPNFNFVKIDDDIVVDNNAVIKELCPVVRKIGSHCTVRTVEAEHGGYFHPEAIHGYGQAFSEIAVTVAPYTTAENVRKSLAIYNKLQADSLLHNSPR